jgi:hypothetical protein
MQPSPLSLPKRHNTTYCQADGEHETNNAAVEHRQEWQHQEPATAIIFSEWLVMSLLAAVNSFRAAAAVVGCLRWIGHVLGDR